MKKQLIIAFVSIALMMCTKGNVAYAGVVGDTFKANGTGFAIVQLMVLSSFGALVYYIVSALGNGQVAGMIKVVTVFSCISVTISVVWGCISNVAKYFHIQL